MKKIILFALVAMAANAALLLIFIDGSEKTDHPVYDFTRRWVTNAVRESAAIDLGVNSFYLAGAHDTHLFLANTTAPTLIVQVSRQLQDTTVHYLSFRGAVPNLTASRIHLDDTTLVLYAGQEPAIFRGSCGDMVVTKDFPDMPFFNDAVSLTRRKSLLRILYRQQSYELATFSGADLAVMPDHLVAQVDGVFCCDGMLTKNPTSGEVFYVHRYRHNFLCMDTAGQLRYTSRTVDPVSRARIKIHASNDGRMRTLGADPLVVNRLCTTYGDRLLVVSKIAAAGDPVSATTSTIDVYDTRDGRYRFSFHLPHPSAGKLSSIVLHRDDLYAIIGDSLVRFMLSNVHATADPRYRKFTGDPVFRGLPGARQRSSWARWRQSETTNR